MSAAVLLVAMCWWIVEVSALVCSEATQKTALYFSASVNAPVLHDISVGDLVFAKELHQAAGVHWYQATHENRGGYVMAGTLRWKQCSSCDDVYDTGPGCEYDAQIWPGTAYYFAQATEQCKSFYYRGCGGSSNLFLSLQGCKALCVDPCTLQDCDVQQ